MTITPAEIQSNFVAWAQTQPDVRAAFVVGSQARRDHPADRWSDVDIILFVKDVERWMQDTAWLKNLGPLVLSVAGRTVAGEPERLALFAGCQQADFVFHNAADLPAMAAMAADCTLAWPDTILRGAYPLLDKEGLFPPFPEACGPAPAVPPSAEEFRQTLEGFWFSAVYCAKQLRRGELWLFQNASGGMLWQLLRMVEWQSRVECGWDYDTWHAGKFIAEWAAPEVYAELEGACSHLDAADGWSALNKRLDLFQRLARQVARGLGYTYPVNVELQIQSGIRAIQSES